MQKSLFILIVTSLISSVGLAYMCRDAKYPAEAYGDRIKAALGEGVENVNFTLVDANGNPLTPGDFSYGDSYFEVEYSKDGGARIARVKCSDSGDDDCSCDAIPDWPGQ